MNPDRIEADYWLETAYDPAPRATYRELVAETRGEHAAHRDAARPWVCCPR